MNIFVLDEDVSKAASYHMDRHVVKMPLETAQMLSTVLFKKGVKTSYRPVHQKHPCTLWAGESRANFLWLCDLGLSLSDEYTFRYGKVHKSLSVIEFAIMNCDVIEEGGLTRFALAMPEEYKQPSAIESYREYYRKGKLHLADWSKRSKPDWY
jgi:hypothetical protein